MEQYAALKNELSIHTAIWIKLTDIMQLHRSQTQKSTACMIPFKNKQDECNCAETRKGVGDWPEGNFWVLEVFCIFMGANRAMYLRLSAFLEVLS